MPSVSDSSHGRDEIGRRLCQRAILPQSTQSINADDSSDEFKRYSCNVRPNLCTSTQKLKWTQELHECFLRAVDHLGGQNKATPKKILHHMNRSGITIAHVKSHLQMYRRGKISACRVFDARAGKLEFEPAAMALIQLKEERISHFRAVSADLPKDSHGNEALQLHLQQISERKLHMQHVETRAFAPVLGLYDEYPRSIKEQEVSQKREPGQTSTCRPDSCSAPSSRSFLGGTTKDSLVETTYSLGGGEEEKSRRGWTWIPRRTPDHAIQVYDSPTLFSKRKILAFILNFQLCE
uniref:HTH myb-type domain-containing protein n=1 Tax=Physcomitrium patens TaxID=3218 RepID=A0A2K1KZT3_PHYPA|nr:hypothetical protein PHYPA_002077 [Physcomitrium patens]